MTKALLIKQLELIFDKFANAQIQIWFMDEGFASWGPSTLDGFEREIFHCYLPSSSVSTTLNLLNAN